MKVFFLVFLMWVGIVASPTFPSLSAQVVDSAALLSPSQKSYLLQTLSSDENNSSNQVVVVTLKSLEGYDIADYGYQLGRHWGIGQKDTNNGVLLIVAPKEHKVRIEVGYGLEGALNDAVAHEIIQTKILPLFKKGKFAEGIISGVDAILLAIKGEYQASEKSKETSILEMVAPLAFLLLMLVSFLPHEFDTNMTSDRIFPSVFSGGMTGFIVWAVFPVLWVGLSAGVIVFLLNLFGKRTQGTSSGYSDSGYYGGGYSLGGSGGFSGGGGSFGGGGASGGW